MYVCMYVCMYVSLCMYVCMYACMYLHINTHLFIYVCSQRIQQMLVCASALRESILAPSRVAEIVNKDVRELGSV